MGAFEYTAVDPRGKEHRGVLEGDTPRRVRQLLRERDLLPLSVTEIAEKESTRQQSFTIRRTLSANNLALITRQIATLVHSGLPVEEALVAVAEQTDTPRVKSIILGVRAKVMEGHTLADGLAEFPKAFPELYRATVSAGEQSGHLDRVLERLADYTEDRQELQQTVLKAMIYPIVLSVLAILIVSGLLVYVVPKVTAVFANQGQDLPGLTVAIIAVSDFVSNYGLYCVALIAVMIWGANQLLKKPGLRRQYDEVMLRVPLVGRLIRGFNTARFTSTFSILMGSGVPVLESLKIAGQVVTNLPMRDAVAEAAGRIREGAAIGKSLETGGYFPPMCIHLISSGEASGELDAMLGRAASNQERELNTLIAILLGLLEPAMIVIMGIIVMIIVLAILMPIFELNQLVG
ncbi:MAG: type II secretion system inner membrane protein GspF [Gammaproteobacteria bacterium]|nr:type II secretion system inner membrane protein GspF [Gammaproteobacteria bacterium]